MVVQEEATGAPNPNTVSFPCPDRRLLLVPAGFSLTDAVCLQPLGGFVSAAEIKRLRAARIAAEQQLEDLMGPDLPAEPEWPDSDDEDHDERVDDALRQSKARMAHKVKVVKEDPAAGRLWSEQHSLLSLQDCPQPQACLTMFRFGRADSADQAGRGRGGAAE